MNILLIEPDYANKFPPLGLMKLSQYHKSKMDRVDFVKGKAKNATIAYDVIYITSLFTFEFKRTVETVKFYCDLYPNAEIYLGGIAATIMSDEFIKNLPKKVKLLPGQLTSSNMLGYTDDVCIDSLVLDYDILDDIDYKYPESDSYFAYFTRGCIRKCAFCAVRILEPNFKSVQGVYQNLQTARERYGEKKYLRLMDNNIMYADDFDNIMTQIGMFGYGKDSLKRIRDSQMSLAFKSLHRRISQHQDASPAIKRISSLLSSLLSRIEHRNKPNEIESIQYLSKLIAENKDAPLLLLNYESVYVSLFDKVIPRSYFQPVVDFNQGIDARGINQYPERAIGLSKIRLDPCRIAYDDYEYTETYINAIKICHEAGIESFSNYLLYNCFDSPEDLYKRMLVNINLNEELHLRSQFSFPMKYAPIGEMDRMHIGPHWSKMQLDSFYIILNVTHGVVVKERDFFYKAYGENERGFQEILHMPHNMVKFRDINEKNGTIDAWKKAFSLLDKEMVTALEKAYSIGFTDYPSFLNEIIQFYK
jgi:hypothetical protein